MGWLRRRRTGRPPQPRRDPQSGAEPVAASFDPSPREMVNESLRALTILGETQRTMQERLELIREVNQVQTHVLTLRTPLSADDGRILQEGLEAMNRLRFREYALHMSFVELLMKWLGEATGQSRGEIIQRLALRLDADLPQDDQPFPPSDG